MNDHDTLGPDQQRADRLDRSWDALLGGTSRSDADLAGSAFIRQLHQMNDAAVFGQGRDRVRQRVLSAAGPQTSRRATRLTRPTGAFPIPGAGDATTRTPRSAPLAWLHRAGRLTEALLAAVLVIALGGTYLSVQRPSTFEKMPLLGGRGTTDRPTSVPLVTRTDGGEFIGVGGKLAFQERSGQLILRLLTLDPGAHWELPPSVSLMITIHSGTLTIDRRPPAGRTVITGPGQLMIGAEPAVMRNNGTTPVVATIGVFVTSSGTDGSVTGSSTFSSVDVASGEIARLPGLEAYVLNGEVTFYGDEALQAPAELTDPGRDGAALVWVSDGVIRLTHLMGNTVVFEADRAVRATPEGPGNQDMLLHTGSSAMITGGARFDLHNGGDGLARVTVITIANLGRVSDSNLITSAFATPGNRATPTTESRGATATRLKAETIDPASCTVAPRPVAAVEAMVASGTPTATRAAVPSAPAIVADGQMPAGQPADERTAKAIGAVERQFVACYNADDLTRLLALMTDRAGRQLLADLSLDEPLADLLAAPTDPLPVAQRLSLFPIHDVRVLPDGRIAAIVEWGRPDDSLAMLESNIHIYERSGDTWLLAEEIGGVPTVQQGG